MVINRTAQTAYQWYEIGRIMVFEGVAAMSLLDEEPKSRSVDQLPSERQEAVRRHVRAVLRKLTDRRADKPKTERSGQS
jgi:hypothetical protein